MSIGDDEVLNVDIDDPKGHSILSGMKVYAPGLSIAYHKGDKIRMFEKTYEIVDRVWFGTFLEELHLVVKVCE